MSLLHLPTVPMLSGHGDHRAEPPHKTRSERDELKAKLAAEKTRSQALQDQLDRAGIDYSGALHDLEEARGEIRRLAAEAIRLQAALDNATSVDVAAGVRDIDPDDQPTQPMDMREVRQRFDTGPIRRIGVSPLAVDPAHIPHAA